MASSISFSLPANGSKRVEEFFSPKKYLAAALVIAAIAAAVLHLYPLLSMALLSVATWCLCSSVIVVVNRRISSGAPLEWLVHRVHAFVTEMNSAIGSLIRFPLCLFKNYHKPQGPTNGRPILMINGHLSSGSVWHYQRPRLAQNGLGPIYTLNTGSGKSIATYAKQVQEIVKRIQKETGRNDISFIGHSKGGLVASYFAIHFADRIHADVTDIVTIGSPLAGTKLAHMVVGQDGKEMAIDSPFHKELRDKIKEHPKTRFFHIASKEDWIVPVPSALFGNDLTKQYVLDDVGHLGLVFSSRVADQISAWLK